MISLIISILCGAAITLLMRIGDEHIKNNMVMFAANYFVCAMLSLFFFFFDGGAGEALTENASAFEQIFPIGIGIIGGVFYLLAFMLMQFNIQKNGMVLATTFMKLGVLVPIVMSIVLGWDKPTVLQIVGCVLAVAAIIVINGEGGTEKEKARSGIWLIILLLVGGFTDSLSNIYDKVGAPAFKNEYLVFVFISAFLVSVIVFFVRKQHFTLTDAFWGVIIGIPNYFASRFMLLALADVPAIVAYPVLNITVILLISLFGFTVFRERLSRRKLIGMGIILAAILVLNL